MLWVSAFVLAAGIAAVLIVFFRNTGNDALTKPTFRPGAPVKVPDKLPTVKLEPAARVVAGRFVLTAVQRKNLEEAWTLVGPQIRQDLTYKQWLTGNIPVVPFLKEIKTAPMKVDLSTKDYALLEVYLLPAKGRGEIFDIELMKVGKGDKARWLVTSWVPRSRPTIPNNPNG
jgi:hypothetical protein